MAKERDLKTKVQQWAEKVGRPTAISRLINKGISPTMARELVNGDYDHDLKTLTTQAIEIAMAG